MRTSLGLIFKEGGKNLIVERGLQREMRVWLWQIVSHDGCGSLVTIHGDSASDKAMLYSGRQASTCSLELPADVARCPLQCRNELCHTTHLCDTVELV